MGEDTKKSIPAFVKKFAEEWRDAWLCQAYGEGDERHEGVMRTAVHAYMTATFPGMLDLFLGIRRDYGRVEMISGNNAPGIFGEILSMARPMLIAEAEKLLGTMNFKFSAASKKRARESMARHIQYALEQELQKLVKARVAAMAEDVLNSLMSDDDWIALAESRLAPTKKPRA